ncbi:hypothetical protein ACWEF9_34635 [Streptomyces sp. NPDC004980]
MDHIPRTSDGSTRWRRILEVCGRPVVPLSLALMGPDRLVIGTVDGRILDCSITGSAGR